MSDTTNETVDTSPIIKFDKVVKRFGDLTVLDELDFEVKRGEKVSIIGPMYSDASPASVLIGQIKKNHSSRTITVPPRGCRVKQTVMCLFTMSKDPVADTSQCQHNQTCSLSCDVFLGLGFGDHRATMVKWWSQTGSNRRHPACKAGALPAELWPHH